MKNTIFFLSAFLLLSTLPGGAIDFENTPQLVIKGEASIFKPADQVEVKIGVVTSAENSTQALNENNQRMHQIVNRLQAIGLDESDYQTGRFHIQPIYRQPPKESPGESTKIDHYEVSNAIQVKTQKLFLADKMVGAAVEGGANQIEQLNFNINNPHAYRAEVIHLATQNALSDAQALANAAAVRLVRVLSLSMDQWQHQPRSSHFSLMAKAGDANQGGVETPLEAGNVELQATVYMTFEIASAK